MTPKGKVRSTRAGSEISSNPDRLVSIAPDERRRRIEATLQFANLIKDHCGLSNAAIENALELAKAGDDDEIGASSIGQTFGRYLRGRRGADSTTLQKAAQKAVKLGLAPVGDAQGLTSLSRRPNLVEELAVDRSVPLGKSLRQSAEAADTLSAARRDAITALRELILLKDSSSQASLMHIASDNDERVVLEGPGIDLERLVDALERSFVMTDVCHLEHLVGLLPDERSFNAD